MKESDMGLELLPLSKHVLQIGKGFTGDTHQDLKEFGTPYNGYTRTKEGVAYWVLPYYYVEQLDVERVVDGVLVAKTYILDELNSFGFDVEEII